MAVGKVLFRIFYSTSFTLAFLVLIVFCCVTPADTLYLSYKRHRLVDIFIITGAYVLTGLIAVFLYSSRLYTNRSVLRDIPKTFLPVEKHDLPNRRVWMLIQDRLARAAVAAYHARPRARRIEVEQPIAGEMILLATKQIKRRHRHLSPSDQPSLTEAEKRLLEPKWGAIEHPGWRSPAARDMAGLEYADVVNQLVDLVEANAVNLSAAAAAAAKDNPAVEETAAEATTTATLTSSDGDDGTTVQAEGKKTPTKTDQIVDLVSRPEHFGMRRYMVWLNGLGVVPNDDATESFLRAYERARFAPRPLSTDEFDDLMRRFADLLRSMKPLDPGSFGRQDGDDDGELSSSSSSAPSARHGDLPPSRISEDSAAPSMSEDDDNLVPSSSQTQPTGGAVRQHGAPASSASASPRSPSLRTQRSSRSTKSNSGSVIRLRPQRRDDDDDDDTDNDNYNDNAGPSLPLPYTIEVGNRNQGRLS